MADAAARAELAAAREENLSQVRVAVADWRPMLARVREVIADLRNNPPPLPAAETAEAVQFLEWLAADNFTLLGARDYVFSGNGDALEPVFETGLGLLRSRDLRLLQRWNEPLTITPDIRAFLQEPRVLVVIKSTVRSRVHRRVLLDFVGIKRFDRDGKLVGECRFCGLFTSTAYTRSVRAIPYLRRKADTIIRRAGFEPSSHSGKALVNVLENYPRDDDRIDDDLLYDRARHSAARRASASAGAAAPRPLRPLRLGSGLHSARPLRQHDQGGNRRVSRHDVQRTAAGVLSGLPGRPAGAGSFYHRPPRGETPNLIAQP